MNNMSFLSAEEIKAYGFACVGENVLISRNASIYNPSRITIGNNVRIDDFTLISAGEEVMIGNNVHIAAFCGLFGRYGIILEDFCGLAARVCIHSATDDFSGNYLTNPTVPEKYLGVKKGRVTIKKHSIIGSGSVIFPGVTIGEGVALGALSLANNDLDDWSVYFGVPCKYLYKRQRDLLNLEKEYLNEINNKTIGV